MKKRLTALLLCLLMIVGVLPTAVMAGAVGTWGAKLHVSENSSVKYDGKNTIELGFGVQSDDLSLKNAQSMIVAIDLNVFDFVTRGGVKADETLNTSFTSMNAGKYVYSKYADAEEYTEWASNIYFAVSGTTGFIMLQPYLSSGSEKVPEEVILASFLVGLKTGKSVTDIAKSSIRLATKEEAASLGQSQVITLTDGNTNKQDYGKTSGADTLTVTPALSWDGITPAKPAPSGIYDITVVEPLNGEITVKDKAEAGTTVTVVVTPDKGYTVEGIRVAYLGANGRTNTVDYEKSAALNSFTFVMPEADVTIYAEIAGGSSFEDVKSGAYYYDAVLWAVENGITNGMTDTTFAPNSSCTRGQAVTFLWRAYGCPEPTGTNNPFTDVKENAYYYKAVLWAVEKGITKGTSKTTFSPNDTCTRGQIVTFQYRAAGSPAAVGTLFNDVKASAYCADAVKWAVAEGITKGTSTTTFSPNDNCTRGQIVTFIYRQIEA